MFTSAHFSTQERMHSKRILITDAKPARLVSTTDFYTILSIREKIIVSLSRLTIETSSRVMTLSVVLCLI
jgi:hypothetical protein